MENKYCKIRLYKPNKDITQKLNTILDLVITLRIRYDCEVFFDNTYTNHYLIKYKDKEWAFGTYPEVIRALDMLRTILKEKEENANG